MEEWKIGMDGGPLTVDDGRVKSLQSELGIAISDLGMEGWKGGEREGRWVGQRTQNG